MQISGYGMRNIVQVNGADYMQKRKSLKPKGFARCSVLKVLLTGSL